jgi:ABC-type nickel/cobalt efflux system permease component RcnA
MNPSTTLRAGVVVTVAVQQAQVVAAVVAMMAVVVMDFQHVLCREVQFTVDAAATLLLQRRCGCSSGRFSQPARGLECRVSVP